MRPRFRGRPRSAREVAPCPKTLLTRRREAAMIAASSKPHNAASWGKLRRGKPHDCRGLTLIHRRLHSVDIGAVSACHAHLGLWISQHRKLAISRGPDDASRRLLGWPPTPVLYTSPAAEAASCESNLRPDSGVGSRREANLPAERAPAKAPARIPCADGDACRSGDPQAPPCQGSQAPVRLTRPRA